MNVSKIKKNELLRKQKFFSRVNRIIKNNDEKTVSREA